MYNKFIFIHVYLINAYIFTHKIKFKYQTVTLKCNFSYLYLQNEIFKIFTSNIYCH